MDNGKEVYNPEFLNQLSHLDYLISTDLFWMAFVTLLVVVFIFFRENILFAVFTDLVLIMLLILIKITASTLN